WPIKLPISSQRAIEWRQSLSATVACSAAAGQREFTWIQQQSTEYYVASHNQRNLQPSMKQPNRQPQQQSQAAGSRSLQKRQSFDAFIMKQLHAREALVTPVTNYEGHARDA
ncbi:hypothetical protein Dimus_001192, partial [Dionaea muscipula]